MSNPVQDARRELKIIPRFVGTVAHHQSTNIGEPHGSGSLGRNDFLPCTLTFATIAALFMQSEIPRYDSIYSGLQMRVGCGAIRLIALFAALRNQEISASKQLAPLSRTRNRNPI
jgi:hypothetical protein